MKLSAQEKRLRLELEKKLGHVALFAVGVQLGVGARPNYRSVSIGCSINPQKIITDGQRWNDRPFQMLSLSWAPDRRSAKKVVDALGAKLGEQSVETHEDGVEIVGPWYGIAMDPSPAGSQFVMELEIGSAALRADVKLISHEDHEAQLNRAMARFFSRFEAA